MVEVTGLKIASVKSLITGFTSWLYDKIIVEKSDFLPECFDGFIQAWLLSPHILYIGYEAVTLWSYYVQLYLSKICVPIEQTRMSTFVYLN